MGRSLTGLRGPLVVKCLTWGTFRTMSEGCILVLVLTLSADLGWGRWGQSRALGSLGLAAVVLLPAGSHMRLLTSQLRCLECSVVWQGIYKIQLIYKILI